MNQPSWHLFSTASIKTSHDGPQISSLKFSLTTFSPEEAAVCNFGFWYMTLITGPYYLDLLLRLFPVKQTRQTDKEETLRLKTNLM
jgi:hypothetical protein